MDTRRLDPPTPLQKKSLSVSDAHAAAAATASRERWRQLLALSNQEMLRELAAQATQAAMDPSKGRSVEQIALDVADRMLEKTCAARLLGEVRDRERDEDVDSQASDSPQLSDLVATPWSVWTGSSEAPEEAPRHCEGGPPSPSDLDCYRQGARDERTRSAASVASLTKAPLPHRPEQIQSPPQPQRVERSTSLPYEAPVFSRRFSEVVSEGALTRTATPDCGAVMHEGLQLLTTTQEYTMMRWHERPKTVLMVAKRGDLSVVQCFKDIAQWLFSQDLQVIVEPKLLYEIRCGDLEAKPCGCRGRCTCSSLCPLGMRRNAADAVPEKWGWGSNKNLFPGFVNKLRTFSPQDELEKVVDLVICIGGDGSLCWAAGLFRRAMPPVIAFAGGSLGFLTPFAMDNWVTDLVPILGKTCNLAPVKIACRMRFQMRLIRHGDDPKDSPVEPIQALNEILIHRGSSGHLCKLEVVVGSHKRTMVQGDGLIVATPTGSTAYSLAAGGSMLHPSVPGILLTPVCPHSLSFRPVVLPDSAVVTVQVPETARSHRMPVAIDGKDRYELGRGDSIEITVSQFPLPTVCNVSVTDDWFSSVNNALQWNLRLEQKGQGQGQGPPVAQL